MSILYIYIDILIEIVLIDWKLIELSWLGWTWCRWIRCWKRRRIVFHRRCSPFRSRGCRRWPTRCRRWSTSWTGNWAGAARGAADAAPSRRRRRRRRLPSGRPSSRSAAATRSPHEEQTPPNWVSFQLKWIKFNWIHYNYH